MSTAQFDSEFIVIAKSENEGAKFKTKASSSSEVPCVVTGLDEEVGESQIGLYTQTDRYVGKFLHLLDEDWILIITSDHAPVCPTYGLRGLGGTGCNIQIMDQLGFTKMLQDKNGELILDSFGKSGIDWIQIKAVANREMYIYLNLKGRNKHILVDGMEIYGLVDPAE